MSQPTALQAEVSVLAVIMAAAIISSLSGAIAIAIVRGWLH